MYKILLIVQYVSVILLLIESVYVFYKWKTPLQGMLFLNCVATLVNNAGYLLIMQSKDMSTYMVANQVSYLGRIWIPFSLFLFVLSFCKFHLDRKVVVGMAAWHIFVYLTVLSAGSHNLYYTTKEYVYDGLFPHAKFGHGIVYNAYSCCMIFYIAFGLWLLGQTLVREKDKKSKERLIVVFVAIAVESLFYIIQITGITGCYDITVMGYAIGTLFMYLAIFKFSLLDVLELAKDYVVDEVSEAIIVTNPAGRIEFFNKPAAKIFPEIKHSPDDVLEEINTSIKGKKPIEVGEKIYSPEVSDLMQNGTSQGRIYVLVDDTEHFHYMEQLIEQKEMAEAANASKSAFISVVSHEIRTPMNAVVGMTDLLLADKESLSDKQERYLKNIKTSGASLVMIVNDILDQSKIEAGKMELVEDDYNLREIADDVKMIIENRIGAKPVKLLCDIEKDVPQYLIGDGLRIRQILINLLNNAVKFTDEGFIQLSVKVEEHAEDKVLLRFGIKDSGQGIKEEDLTKLGEAFQQVDTKRNHSKEGTGLGLSISKNFISMMGGQLSVSSEYGKGSVFYFSIWQGIGKEMSEAEILAEKNLEEEDFLATKAKVLVVDDTEINLTIAKEILATVGIDADIATSGERGIELIKQNKYDIIFMDFYMPSMDGVEATELIRNLPGSTDEEEYFKRVPIIALTGDISDETKEKFSGAGINDFTEKPIDIKRLKGILLKWLDSKLIERQ